MPVEFEHREFLPLQMARPAAPIPRLRPDRNFMASHGRRLGLEGEAAAAHWYVRHGFTVRDRNWRCRDGEIDLVLEDATRLVVCEVKTRSSLRYGSGAEAVDWRKQRTIRLVTAQYLAARPLDHRMAVRFDVAVVVPGAHGYSVEVIEDAF